MDRDDDEIIDAEFEEIDDDDDGTGLNIGCSFTGCIGIVIGCIVIWGLLFGFTIGGVHYGLSECSCDEGVVIDTGTPVNAGR